MFSDLHTRYIFTFVFDSINLPSSYALILKSINKLLMTI